jgi:hypothetical protein
MQVITTDTQRQLRPVPDLLKRFAPTPLRATARLGPIQVAFETNDPSFLAAFSDFEGASSDTEATFVWKLVRDSEVGVGPLEPILIVHAGVTALSMGPACLIAIDHDARELVGFIGSAVGQETFRRTILPLLQRLSRPAGAGEIQALGWPTQANGADA